MSRLTACAFTGADDATPLEELLPLQREFPFIEWAVLFDSQKMGKPRYPSDRTLEQLVALQVPLAVHLCGDECTRTLNGDTTVLERLKRWGIKRVQFNAHVANGAAVPSTRRAAVQTAMHKNIVAFPEIHFIISLSSETLELFEPLLEAAKGLPNVDVFFDESKGAGRAPTTWPAHRGRGVHCGYSGGFGPHNIETVLRQLGPHVGQGCDFWIDMETAVRSGEKEASALDLGKCRSVADTVRKLSIEGCFKLSAEGNLHAKTPTARL